MSLRIEQGSDTMKISRYTYFLLLIAVAGLFLLREESSAQPAEPIAGGAVGTEYYVGFLPNDDAARSKFTGLLVTSQVSTRVDVAVPNESGGMSVKSYDVFPGQITSIPITQSVVPQISEEVSQMAVHVTSRAPVSVVAVNARYQSDGAYPVLPVSFWGRKYLVGTLPNAVGAMSSQMLIVASEDSTWLTVRPSVRTYRQDAGREINVLLNRGQTFLIQANPGNPGIADLSGSEVVSWSRPVGIVAGHMRTSITADGSVPETIWSSHMAAMLTPDSAWGTDYFTSPLRNDREDRYRLIASANNTSVSANYYPPEGGEVHETFLINRGDVLDITAINGRAIRGPVHWKATGPLSLVQLRLSGSYSDQVEAPAMIPAVASEVFSNLSVFAAPGDIGGDPFPVGSFRLSIVVTAPANATAESVLSALILDGRPLNTLQLAPIVLRYGSENAWSVMLPINAGGHLLVGGNGYKFSGTVAGNNGGPARDAYASSIPYWIPQAEIDQIPPFLVNVWRDQAQTNVVNARISDNRAPAYFSGVWSVKVVNSPGWELFGGFTAPNPDDDGTVRFRAVADPSGPLFAEIRDRDGNSAIIRVSNEICLRTATVDENAITITAPSNELPRTRRVVVSANPCGDSANVEGVTLGVGNANPYLLTEFAGASAPFVISSHGADSLDVTVKAGTPEGTWQTTVLLKIDGVTFTIPVVIVVGKASSVPVVAGYDRGDLSAEVFPNPFALSTTLVFDRPLSGASHAVIYNGLGAAVRNFPHDELAGRHSLVWTGTDGDGRELPSGVYMVAVTDGASRLVRQITLVR